MKPTSARIVTCIVACSIWAVWIGTLGPERAVAMLAEHYLIPVTMSFASLVAGGTSVGGGAVAFPVFTKVLGVAPRDALIFSLAIQSVGMTVASGYILLSQARVRTDIIALCSLGGALGLPAGYFLIQHVMPAPAVKVTFSLFGLFVGTVLLLVRFSEPAAFLPRARRRPLVIIVAGMVGGVLSGVIGTGIDFVAFTLMMLLMGEDIKVATATSVVIMAINAIVGIALIEVFTADFSGRPYEYWLAAVPVVVVGAPIGAWLCRIFSQDVILVSLLVLITIEASSTLLIVANGYLMLLIPLIFSGMFVLSSAFRGRVFSKEER